MSNYDMDREERNLQKAISEIDKTESREEILKILEDGGFLDGNSMYSWLTVYMGVKTRDKGKQLLRIALDYFAAKKNGAEFVEVLFWLDCASDGEVDVSMYDNLRFLGANWLVNSYEEDEYFVMDTEKGSLFERYFGKWFECPVVTPYEYINPEVTEYFDRF